MKSLPSALAFLLLTIAVHGPSALGQTKPAAPPPAAPKLAPPKAAAPVRVPPRRFVPIDSFQLKPPSTIAIGNFRVTTQDLRDGNLIVLDSATKKPTKRHTDSMQAMARELVYALTDPKYYSPPEPTNNLLRPVPSELTLDSRFSEADRFILVPSWGRKLSIDQADYIVWFGVAMDEAIRDILDPKPAKAGDPEPAVPAIMRVNAARMLAHAARSGAPAHYPTILNLLTDPNTDPEVLIYAIKAAEGLIAAYNPILRDDAKYMIHMIKDAEMVKLVEALDAIIVRTKPYGRQPAVPPPAPTPAAPAPKAADPKAPPVPVGQLQANTISTEQRMVIRYFRRAAIRALAQVRYPQFVDAQSGKAVYPIVTLAKIAVGDASITTAPGNDEIAAATVGLCNLHSYKDVNADALCDFIAQGVANFAGKKAGNSQDKSIPWKVVGSRLITALADMQRVPNAGKYRAKFESLATVMTERVLVPLEKIASPGNAPNFEALQRWRETNRPTSMKLLFEAKVPAVVPAFIGT